jgi:cytochrome c biogenesis protein CcmG/thiol:disulfide interchange protein DsbE
MAPEVKGRPGAPQPDGTDPVSSDQPALPGEHRSRRAGSSRRAERKMAIGLWAVLAVTTVVAVLALVEIRSRGTSTVGGFTVANYEATAESTSTPAPTFELPSLDGGAPIALASFRDRVVVLNFWASWCAPCRLEAPGLRRTSARYRDRGVRFLGVDYQDDDDAGRAFIREFRLRYPSVTDHSGRLAYRYGLIGFPTTFIIDPAGTIRYRFVGYLNEDVLSKALEKVLRTGET